MYLSEIRTETSIYTAKCSLCFRRLPRAVIPSLISIWHWEAFRGFTTSAASVDALSVCHLFLASRCSCAKTKRVSIQPITETDVLFCKLSLACVSKTQVSISISFRYSIFQQIQQAVPYFRYNLRQAFITQSVCELNERFTFIHSHIWTHLTLKQSKNILIHTTTKVKYIYFTHMSTFFPSSRQYMRRWYRLQADDVYLYRRCFMYDVDVRREEGKLLVQISSIQSWSEGPYRCISEDSSAPDNSSESLTIPIHCEWESDRCQHRGLFESLGNCLRLFAMQTPIDCPEHKSIRVCLHCLDS